MTADRWRQIEDLFAQALECPPSELSGFLDKACDGDGELRRELESLLNCDTPEQRLIQVPALASVTLGNGGAAADLTGQRIGPYRISGLVGHGGMGSVYLGQRDDDQFRKQVAIKLLKRGMDTDFMLARFRQERQILANLEHPFIARMLDGGATADGLPYFVMEYVDGLPITRYCSERNVAFVERLRLFRLVCEAVQHAHQRLVVHRDIKPSNILTTNEGVPKLLDFGIAKVLDPGQSSGVTMTQREQRMLTPDYASPEQMKGLPISTASDIYSLGAVLYELLCGQRPHRFTSNSLSGMERVICEVEPEKPSIAAGEDRQLRRQLSGDLDNIILTAMRKDPQRRYASAAELSEDLRRHIEGLPILAEEDRWSYRAGKFLRRNRLSVAAALLLAASLIGGIVATTFQARRADRRFQLVRQLANTMLFELHDQVEPLPGSMSARVSMVQTVVRYLDGLAHDSGGDPTLDLEIAKAYMRVAALEGAPFRSSLGQTGVALVHLQKAIGILERLAARPDTRVQAIREVAAAHIEAGAVEDVLGHHASAMAHLKRVAALAEEVSSQAGAELTPSVLATLYLRLGSMEAERGDMEAERANVSKAVEICRKWVDAEPGLTALGALRDANSQLANGRAHAGDMEGARDAFQLALNVAGQMIRRPDSSEKHHYGLVGIHHLYGDVLGASDDPNLGQPAEALTHYQAAAALGESFAAKDPKDINVRRNLAGSYRRVGLMLLEDRAAEALQVYRKAVAISTSLSALEPRNIHYRSALADGLLGVAEALHRLGRGAEALETLSRTLELQKSIEAAAPNQLWLLRTTSRAFLAMGNVHLKQGDADQALASYREGLATAERSLHQYRSSLSLELDRADLLEAIGGYYVALAKRPNVIRARRAEWRTEARSHFQKSLERWQDWSARKVAVSYAARRMSRMVAAIASINQAERQ